MNRWIVDIILFIVLIQISHIGFLGYLLARELSDVFMRYRQKGQVTPTGLKRTRDTEEIPFDAIEKIEAGYERSIFLPNTIVADIHTRSGSTEICLGDEDIVKLIKTRMSNWSISTIYDLDKKLITVTPGRPDDPLQITYNDVGRFAVSPYIPSLVGFPVFCLAIGGLFFDFLEAWGFILIFVLFAGICFLPSFYKQVAVTVSEEGASLRDGAEEHFLTFDQVVKVEKMLLRIKVITKNSKIFFFPRACYLLDELIKVLAKPRVS